MPQSRVQKMIIFPVENFRKISCYWLCAILKTNFRSVDSTCISLDSQTLARLATCNTLEIILEGGGKYAPLYGRQATIRTLKEAIINIHINDSGTINTIK